MKIDFQIPVRTISEMNDRSHWAVRLKRKKEQQAETALAFRRNVRREDIEFPCVIRLIRIAPKALDVDNLASSGKFIQDQLAKELGIDDGDITKVTWEYGQRPIGQRFYSVKVEIR